MLKQVHLRIDDYVYEALTDYTKSAGISVQDSVSFAIIQMLDKQKKEMKLKPDFTFIDLFAGIGGMRIVAYIPMNGINTVSRHISLISVTT